MKKDRSSHKKHKNKLWLILLFMAGSLIALYPFYVGAVNNFIDQQRIRLIEKETAADISKKEAAMAKKNAQITQFGLHPGVDPFSGADTSNRVNLKKHLIGSVEIAKIRLRIPLFDETNSEILNYGAGVLQGTSFPLGGPNTHSVITGHRGLAQRTLFTNLNQLKKGDLFILTVLKKKLAYRVDRIRVVKPNNYRALRIEPGRDLVTLLTCTPYMINSHRLLVTGHRVAYHSAMGQQARQAATANNWIQISILAAVLLLAAGQLRWLYRSIHASLIAKNHVDLALRIYDRRRQEMAGVTGYLMAVNRKKPLKRRGRPIMARSDLRGRMLFADLPGSLYYLKLTEGTDGDGCQVGMRHLGDRQMRFYPDGRQKWLFINHDGQLAVYLDH
ncbi:MAG: class C sortase [Oenococcus sp.]|uniref:class C sortase n=1 Tax=Oenococcus sp. TaxID=1979414 RepID=UPI0039E9DF9B